MPAKKKVQNIDKREAMQLTGKALKLIASFLLYAPGGIDKQEAQRLHRQVAELADKIASATAD